MPPGVETEDAIAPLVGELGTSAPPRRRRSPLRRARRRTGWLVVLPALALTAAVLWTPIGQAVYRGFTRWDGATSEWIGLGNYKSFINSPDFKTVVLNNIVILFAIPILVIMPLAMGFLVGRVPQRFRNVVRLLFFLPVPLSWAVVGIVGAQLFADNGPINSALESVGLGFIATDWLGSGSSAMTALIVLVIWALFGLNFVVYQGALSSFDDTLVEAARVDGARPFRIFWEIVVPVLLPFVRFITVYSITLIYATLFGLIYVFSQGGPAHGTTTLEFYVYTVGFTAGQFGAAAAAGVLLLIVILLVNLPQLKGFLRGS